MEKLVESSFFVEIHLDVEEAVGVPVVSVLDHFVAAHECPHDVDLTVFGLACLDTERELDPLDGKHLDLGR